MRCLIITYSTNMNNLIIPLMIEQLQSRNDLLTPIDTAPFNLSLIRLTYMLNSLPQTSPVLGFMAKMMAENMDQFISVKAYAVDGHIGLLQPPKCFGQSTSTRGVTTHGGVYLWTAAQEGLQYVGSTINHKMRLGGHLSNMTHAVDPLRLQLMHLWAADNGGLPSLVWGEIYRTFNYFQAFLQSDPYYIVSCHEVMVLKALSELLPRILESSLINKYHPAWNQQTTVNFHYLYKDRPVNWSVSPISVYNYDTGKPVRVPFPNRDVAINTLGLSEWKYGINLNNLNGFYSETFEQKVVLQQANKQLVAKNETKLFFTRKYRYKYRIIIPPRPVV